MIEFSKRARKGPQTKRNPRTRKKLESQTGGKKERKELKSRIKQELELF